MLKRLFKQNKETDEQKKIKEIADADRTYLGRFYNTEIKSTFEDGYWTTQAKLVVKRSKTLDKWEKFECEFKFTDRSFTTSVENVYKQINLFLSNSEDCFEPEVK